MKNIDHNYPRDQQVIMENKQAEIQHIYDKYAGMLLGYISEVVENKALAEQYLVNIFCDISLDFDQLKWNDQNCWSRLLRYTQNKLTAFNVAASNSEASVISGSMVRGANHKDLDQMTIEQKQVFCEVYYCGKSINAISRKINKTEDSIRKTLQEAFVILRRGCEN